MHRILPAAIIAGALTVSPGALAADAVATIIGGDGAAIGEVSALQSPNGVVMTIRVTGLEPGAHGMHLHRVGTCDDHGSFTASQGHVAPHGKPHGFLNPEGHHPGDLPNLIVAADGTAHVELFNTFVTVSGGEAALLDADGTALVIHADPDDHLSQPIGGSGARVACAVFQAG